MAPKAAPTTNKPAAVEPEAVQSAKAAPTLADSGRRVGDDASRRIQLKEATTRGACPIQDAAVLADSVNTAQAQARRGDLREDPGIEINRSDNPAAIGDRVRDRVRARKLLLRQNGSRGPDEAGEEYRFD